MFYSLTHNKLSLRNFLSNLQVMSILKRKWGQHRLMTRGRSRSLTYTRHTTLITQVGLSLIKPPHSMLCAHCNIFTTFCYECVRYYRIVSLKRKSC